MGTESKWTLGIFWKEISRKHKLQDWNKSHGQGLGPRLTGCSSVMWEWNHTVLALWDQELSSRLDMPCCAVCTLQSSCSLPKSESVRGTSNPNKRVSQVPSQISDFAELFKLYRGGGSHHPMMIRYTFSSVKRWELKTSILPALDSSITHPNSNTV